MDSLADASGAMKRKRSPSDVLPPQSRPAPSTPSTAAPNPAVQINYLTRQKNDKLRLIEGDDDTFAEVLQLLDEYEGILQRRESLAGNLGANLVGPLLLNAFENYFQGPIYLIGTTKAAPAATISWVDIVNFAREHPESFFLEDDVADAQTTDQSGTHAKVCRFWIKNNRVQISENDWKLIVSGVPARMLPEQLNPEDENTEMVTLDIVEGRLSALIKKADAVATRTRQLNYQMKGRKQAIMARRSGGQMPLPGSEGDWSQPSNNNPYAARAPNQQDLLRQFSLHQQDQSTPSRNQSGASKKLKTSSSSGNLNSTPAAANPSFTSINQANSSRNTSSPHPRSKKNDKSNLEDPPYRALMVAHIEKLNRGDAIWPPCDRCRRLKMQCTKNYTACMGCTKKHCKCYFKDVGQDEVMIAGLEAESEGDANSDTAEKKPEGDQNLDEAVSMLNANDRASHDNLSAYGQESRDIEMGGVGSGIPRPGSANISNRGYYDEAETQALFQSLDRKASPNGAPSVYASNPNTMTATMTVPNPSSTGVLLSPGGANTDTNQASVYGMSMESDYKVPAIRGGGGYESNVGGGGGIPPPSSEDTYSHSHSHQHPHAHQHHQNQNQLPNRENQVQTTTPQQQAEAVNYIRPIGNAGIGEQAMRDVYSLPGAGEQVGEFRGQGGQGQRDALQDGGAGSSAGWLHADLTRHGDDDERGDGGSA